MFFVFACALVLDSAIVLNVQTAPAESLRVTIVGEGQPVILIPGLAGSAFAFRQIVPSLAAHGLKLVVIEPLGVGHSARPSKADYSLTAQADRIAAVMDTLGITGPLVVAHSVSVSMALRLAVRHPERVSQILAIDGGPDEKLSTATVRKAVKYGFLLRLFAGRGRIRSEVRKAMVAASGDTTWITPAVLDGYTSGSAGDVGAILRTMKGMANAVEPDSITNNLHLINVPVWLMLGTAPHDGGISHHKVELMQQRIPNFAIDSVPGSGLHIHEEQPDVVVAEVLRILGKS